MKARLIVALLLIVFTISGLVLAQEFNPCFSLSEDDCTALEEASANTALFLADQSSFSVDVDFTIDAQDLPDEDMASFSLSVVGTLDFVQNEESMAMMDAHGAFDVAAAQGGAGDDSHSAVLGRDGAHARAGG